MDTLSASSFSDVVKVCSVGPRDKREDVWSKSVDVCSGEASGEV
jgi:hypothetical protein